MKKNDDKKYWQKFQEMIDNSLDQFYRIVNYDELNYYKQQTAYYKGKAEAYERMLIKAKLITSGKENIIHLNKIKEQ